MRSNRTELMKVTPLAVPDVLSIEPVVHRDDRGLFLESWNRKSFVEHTGVDADFVQDNHSRSRKGVLRGLHYQLEPMAQGKLVRVVQGVLFDVAVDIRRSSETFGRWVGLQLSAENHRQLWVPPGFAHGFFALTDPADLVYKTTEYYSAEHDRSIRWDDPDIGIDWPLDGDPILSDKDATAPYLRDVEVFA
jgi:dTDP-4-dehydrorhamnose 3,5-epimerase